MYFVNNYILGLCTLSQMNPGARRWKMKSTSGMYSFGFESGGGALNFYLTLFCSIIFTSSQRWEGMGWITLTWESLISDFSKICLKRTIEIFDCWRYMFIIPEFYDMDDTCINYWLQTFITGRFKITVSFDRTK